jgi:hypothetical protein
LIEIIIIIVVVVVVVVAVVVVVVVVVLYSWHFGLHSIKQRSSMFWI